MPPNRLQKRLDKLERCGACRDSDFVWDEEKQAMRRCFCARGRTLRAIDQARQGKQEKQTELELQ